MKWPQLLNNLRGDVTLQLWRTAARRLLKEPEARLMHGRRQVRLGLLTTHTTDFLAELLPVAALSCGIDLTVLHTFHGRLETELLDPVGPLRTKRPDYVLLCGTEEDLQLRTAPPDEVVAAAVERWCGLWHRITGVLGARTVQCLFTLPADEVYGNAAVATGDSDTAVVSRVNTELVRRGGDGILFVDCDRLAAEVGRGAWCDLRYWDVLRQPVSLDALPLLARAVAAVLGADLGLSRRCVVVDLDNTLWDGVLGEEGPAGVRVGHGPIGGPFARFQQYLLGLRRRGIVLAVASKNDGDLVHRALDEVPGMQLRRDDFAVVVADWRPKSEQLRQIAAQLNLGLDSLAFVDDNPAECAQVSNCLPEVDVILLPAHPACYVRALAGRPTLEGGRPTADDQLRLGSYAALGKAEALRVATDSLEEFLDSLRMQVQVRLLAPRDLERAEQLLHKTNQFNLTTRRHRREQLAKFIADPQWRCFTLLLRDRFADHGMVGLLLLRLAGNTAEIDTLLLSCRMIGRTVERRLVAVAAAEARAAGCSRLLGVYVPSERNTLVASLYPDLGFHTVVNGDRSPDGTCWYCYPLAVQGPADTPHLLEEYS